MSLIESLRSKGTMIGRGEFTLDASKAATKLGHSQLGDPSRFLLELIAGFHAMHLERVEISWKNGLLSIDISPTQLELEHPGLIGSQLLNPNSIYQRVAVALSAVEARQGYCIYYGTNGECYGQPNGGDNWMPQAKLSRLEFHQTEKLAKLALAQLSSRSLLRPSLQLWVEGEKIEPKQLEWPWGCLRNSSQSNPEHQTQVSMSPNLVYSEIVLVKNGLVYPSELVGFSHPVQAVVEGLPFKLDAAYSKVINDLELEAIHQTIKEQFWLQVESYLQDNENYDEQVIQYWAPKLGLDLLMEHPCFEKLPCFRTGDGKKHSLQQLYDRKESISICTDHTLSLRNYPGVVMVDSEAHRKVLASYLGDRFEDVTANVQKDWERQESYRKFLTRRQTQATLATVTTLPIEHQTINIQPPYEGQISINSDSTTSRLTLLYQHRRLVELEREAPNPYLAVVNLEDLAVNSSFDGVESLSQLEPLFMLLNQLSLELYQELAKQPDQHSQSVRRHLANLITKSDGLQTWSLFYDTPLFRCLSKNPLDPESVEESNISLNQIKRFYEAGQRLGFIHLDQRFSLKSKFQLLGVEHLMFLKTKDHSTICSFLKTSNTAVPNLESLIKKLDLRFNVKRECILEHNNVRELFQQVEQFGTTDSQQLIQCQLAIFPSRGSTKLELLRGQIACGVRQLELGPLAAIAILDCSGLQPTLDWSDVEDDQVWQSCLNLIQQAYKSAVDKVVLEFVERPQLERLRIWKDALTELVSINWPLAKQMGLLAAFPKPISVAELERCHRSGYTVDYLLQTEAPENCKKLVANSQCGFILFGLPNSKLFPAAPDLKSRNLANRAQQARLEQRLLKQPINFPGYSDLRPQLVESFLQLTGIGLTKLTKGYSAYLAYSLDDCQAYLAVGPEASGLLILHKRGRLVQRIYREVPTYCDLYLNCNEFEVSMSLDQVENLKVASQVIAQWPQKLHQLVQSHSKETSPQLILQWLLETRLPEETRDFLKTLAVWPTLHGLRSLDWIAESLRPEDEAIAYLQAKSEAEAPGHFEGDLFRGSQEIVKRNPQYAQLTWPAMQQPVVLILDLRTKHYFKSLSRILKKPLREFNQGFGLQMFSRWKGQIYAKQLVDLPPAFASLELKDIGFLCIPSSSSRNRLIVRTQTDPIEIFEELTYNFPICGSLATSPEDLHEQIWQLYASFSQQSFRQSDIHGKLQALIAFCHHHCKKLLELAAQLQPDQTDHPTLPPSRVTMLRAKWLPAQDNSWVSLHQLRCWASEGILPRPLPYLTSPGRPEESRDFPLLVLPTPEWITFISNWTGRRLEPVKNRSIKNHLSNIYNRGRAALSKIAQEAGQSLGNLVGPAFRKLEIKEQIVPLTYDKTTADASEPVSFFSKKGENKEQPSLKRSLLRESRRLTGGSTQSRRHIEGQLKSLEFSKHLFGPAFWRNPESKTLHLNLSHRQIRTLLAQPDNLSGVVALLTLLIAEINLDSIDVSDSQEISMLEHLLTTLVDGFPDGFKADNEATNDEPTPTVPTKPKKSGKKRKR